MAKNCRELLSQRMWDGKRHDITYLLHSSSVSKFSSRGPQMKAETDNNVPDIVVLKVRLGGLNRTALMNTKTWLP